MRDASKPRSKAAQSTGASRSGPKGGAEGPAASGEAKAPAKRPRFPVTPLLPEGFRLDIVLYLRRDADGDFDTCEHRMVGLEAPVDVMNPTVAAAAIEVAIREIESSTGPGWRMMTRAEVKAHLLAEKRASGPRASKSRMN